MQLFITWINWKQRKKHVIFVDDLFVETEVRFLKKTPKLLRLPFVKKPMNDE